MTRHRYKALLYALEGVTQAYAGRTVLSVDFMAIKPQNIVGLTGHNGSGKSTLLRILAFLEEPAQGRLFFEGKPCSTPQSGLGRKVTMLPQEPYLLKRSVRDNVAYGLKVRGTKDPGKRVAEVLNMVGLPPEEFSGRSWHQLSGGEAQRVALAARLVLRPQVLLLDEPTTSLDMESTRLIKEASLAARKVWGATLVVVSHDMPWLESICDKILVLADGRLVN